MVDTSHYYKFNSIGIRSLKTIEIGRADNENMIIINLNEDNNDLEVINIIWPGNNEDSRLTEKGNIMTSLDFNIMHATSKSSALF